MKSALEYRFTVIDPETWASSWTASVPMRRTDQLMYEFACHEGNYGLTNMLAGACRRSCVGSRDPVIEVG